MNRCEIVFFLSIPVCGLKQIQTENKRFVCEMSVHAWNPSTGLKANPQQSQV